jgi:hypothetical protein
MSQADLTPSSQPIDELQGGIIPARFHLECRPALDGFRGVAIILVILTHLEIVRNNYGFIGVDMFLS